VSNIKIGINTNPKFKPFRALFVYSMFAGLIGLGVATDSAAMQWAGFMLASLATIAWVWTFAKQDRNLTIEQARARLDEIEREEA
jgi:hypothetical protein